MGETSIDLNRMVCEGTQQGMKVTTTTFYKGLHWVFENNKLERLSIICLWGSYGHENGLFEIRSPWNKNVSGDLTFRQVQTAIDRLKKREATK